MVLCLCTTQAVIASDIQVTQNLTVDDDSDSINNAIDDAKANSATDKLGASNLEVLSAGERTLNNLYAYTYYTDEGGVYDMPADYKYNPSTDDYLYEYGVYIFKSITIDGHGHYIDGAGAGPLMFINANNVILKNITFINGVNSPVKVYGNNVQFIDCKFINNTGSWGGAVYSEATYATLTNCKFENNTATSYGGAIDINKGILDIDGCDFIDNKAKYGGGAVHIEASATDQVISNSNFTGNSLTLSTIGGGAVSTKASRTTIRDSTFDQNNAKNKGGAVYIDADDCTIEHTAFTHNYAENGGAIYWKGNGGSLTNSWDIYENEAQYGGAIYFDGTNGNIYNSRIHHNKATNTGGGLYLNGPVNIIYSHFDSNNAVTGGSIYADYSADGTYIDHTNFGQNWIEGEGGAIFWEAPNGIVNNSVFYNNGVSGENFAPRGGAVYWNGEHGLINNSQFTYNYAYNYYYGGSEGAALYVNDAGKDLSVENSKFEDNTAYSYGGAISWKGENGKVYNSVFNRNKAATEGGAIYSKGKNLSINKSKFNNNDATYLGGALALEAIATINGSEFQENTANKGGAVYWDAPNGTVNNSYFYKNKAYYAGGAISADYYLPEVEKHIHNSLFEENYAQNYGGAIASLYTEIVNSTFKNNRANVGEAINSYSTEISDDSTFINNDVVVQTTELIEINFGDSIGNSTRKTNTTYIAVCVERYTQFPHLGLKDDSLSRMINIINHESIADYLKILIYNYYNSTDDVFRLAKEKVLFYSENDRDNPDHWNNLVPISAVDYLSRAVHEFSDHDYWNSDHPLVKQTLELYRTVYDNGNKIPDKFIKEVNGSLIEYDFSSMISSTSQSLFLFNMIKHNMTVEKIALDDIVYLGNQTRFKIVVTNNGESILGNITVNETKHDGLKLVNYTSDEDSWTGNIKTGIFKYNGILKPGEKASFIVIFDTLIKGNLTNVVVGSSNQTKNKTANNTTEVVPIRVNVTKVWDDDNNRDKLRPNNVTIYLWADGVKIKEIVLNDTNKWNFIFKDLPMVKKGKIIDYKVTEKLIDGYTAKIINNTVDDFTKIVANNTYVFTINNTHVPARTNVSVVKIWSDKNNQDGIMPDNVTVVLFADGKEINRIVLNASNRWSFTFTNLLVYKHNGTKIEYTVNETAVPGYTANITSDGKGNWTVNNTHVPAVTVVNVTKVWDDANNQDGVRPESVTVVLVADGTVVDRVTLDASNNWTALFENLPVKSAGEVINYTIEEVSVVGYESAVSNSSAYNWTVTNTHVPVVTEVNVAKKWIDADNQDGVRPDKVTVVLVADGNVVDSAVLDDSNDWAAVFGDLPVYSAGNVIKYEVQELSVANYSSVVSNETAYVWTVTNTHVPVVTEVNVAKVWNDANNQDAVRANNVTVVLLADGIEINRVVLNSDNDWKFTFENLPVYNAGEVIKYTIEELDVANYTAAISNNTAYDWTVVNTHVPAVTQINVVKVWNDENNKNNVRPDSIRVILIADSHVVGYARLDNGNKWKHTFSNLPVYNNGKTIKYSIAELDVQNYTVQISDDNNGNFVITNTIVEVYTPDTSVELITHNETVDEKEEVVIIVKNNGTTNLKEIYVTYDNLTDDIIQEILTYNDDWVFDGVNKFIYNKTLGANESVNLTIVYNITHNENNETPVDNTTEQNETSNNTTNETNETIPPEVVTPSPEHPVPAKPHVTKHVKPDSHATGNPLVLLLLALMIPLIRRKQK
ncbi:Cna B-type domain-containing protein [Methanobrevibacter sp.]|uniref:Cna B-type domain-containing protein n=1 Tax=Methanobrevibacter sp. TaxID=66852 RepID=UPI00388DCC76